MENDIASLSTEDLRLLFDAFSVVRSGDYPGSDVQMGFRLLFNENDKNNDGYVERSEFYSLMRGYYNSKHLKPT